MDNILRLAAPLTKDSIVDGPGLRMVLWTQGCPHGCPGCHNPQTHDETGGFVISIDDLEQQIRAAHLQSGLTLSGGEPMQQAETLAILMERIQDLNLSIWCYSGYTYEQILKDENKSKLLPYLDVLVDGRFLLDQYDYRLRFKGSKNQRIIDVKASQTQSNIIISSYDEQNNFE